MVQMILLFLERTNDTPYPLIELMLCRTKLELQRSRQSSLTPCLGVARYSTGNHKAMNLINSCHTLSHASYPWREDLLLGLKSQKRRSLKHDCTFVKGRELSELKRCIMFHRFASYIFSKLFISQLVIFIN